jgi:hypothetical protein
MIVTVALVVLLVAVTAGFTGVYTDAGSGRPWTENFAVSGYRPRPVGQLAVSTANPHPRVMNTADQGVPH